MKAMKRFWDKRSKYEKTILGLLLGFCVFCLGYFSRELYYGSRCDVCKQTLREGEHYILDVRTGELLNLSDYVDRESTAFWFSAVSIMPQEVSASQRLGYMRFPQYATTTARYCASHTANLDADFLMLSPTEDATVCYAVRDGRTLDPDGHVITKWLNEELGCWELEVQWDVKANG